jgi:hypothetical protein
MCGIVGVVRPGSPEAAREAVARLLRLSETRGSEAAGVAGLGAVGIEIAKAATDARRFARSQAFASVFDSLDATPRCVIGHTRLVTNGSAIFGDNNQPVAEPGFAMVHNGIVVNADRLWHLAGIDRPPVDVDSAGLLARIVSLRSEHGDLVKAVSLCFGELNGSASIALMSDADDLLVLATNTGSIYLALDDADRLIAFGSERPIVEAFRSSGTAVASAVSRVEQVVAGTLIAVPLSTGVVERSELEPYVLADSGHPSWAPRVVPTADEPSTGTPPDEGRWRRCTRCILPETFPFITFDERGVCSQCHSYEPVPPPDREALEELLRSRRRPAGEPDCIVAFSGGRDSSYGLHMLVEEFGMRPLVLTYDWGMVTDLARRNQARLIGKLGVEHILISANIARKRKNIQRNMAAWLRRPELGMVPLLMAGDKQFFTHSARLSANTGLQTLVFCINPLEMTYFKAGFAGVAGQRYYASGWRSKANLMRYYGTQFAKNPRYLNRSLLDSASAFRASYFTPHDYIQLFEHIPWDEDQINEVLIDQYHWETDPSTPTTWRIGDGTAAFYNWVYYEAVGFTENDTFRSNQIREGVISRSRALELVNVENRPRFDRIREYFDLIDLPVEPAERAVRDLASRYETAHGPRG